MKFDLQFIKETRYDPQRSAVRKMQERFVLVNVLVKALSPYPTYVFLNMRIHPDTITIASFLFIAFGSLAFVFSAPILGIVLFFIFTLLDSVDGDMARCTQKSAYGSTLDSFGADLFYALSPVAVSYYVYMQSTSFFNGADSVYFLLIGFGISLSFLFYRLVNAKIERLRVNIGRETSESIAGTTDVIRNSLIRSLAKGYRHALLRGNFFTEPGMVLWYSFLVLINSVSGLGAYLVILFVYNLGYMFMNIAGAYAYMKSLRTKI